MSNVTLHTSMVNAFLNLKGPIEIELYWDEAPKTCKNFWELSKRGYYNGTKFHRIVKVSIYLTRKVCGIYIFVGICRAGW